MKNLLLFTLLFLTFNFNSFSQQQQLFSQQQLELETYYLKNDIQEFKKHLTPIGNDLYKTLLDKYIGDISNYELVEIENLRDFFSWMDGKKYKMISVSKYDDSPIIRQVNDHSGTVVAPSTKNKLTFIYVKNDERSFEMLFCFFIYE